MAKHAVGPRIDPTASKFYEDHFDTLNQGATYTLEAFPALYRGTLRRELKGKFEPGELSLLIDVVNSLMLTPGFAGQQLQADVEDGIALDSLDTKWQINGPALIDKLATLNLFQMATLEIWAKAFWMQSEYNEAGALELWVTQLA